MMIMKKLLFLFVVFILSMPNMATAKQKYSDSEQLKIIKDVYHNEFLNFVENTITIEQNKYVSYLDYFTQSKLVAQKNARAMCKSIEAQCERYGINVNAELNENDTASLGKIEYLYKDKFNPAYIYGFVGSIAPAHAFAKDLSKYGVAVVHTGYFVGNVQDNYYNSVYIVASSVNCSGAFFSYFDRLEEHIMFTLHYHKIPFLSKNINMRKAELAVKNLDYATAEHYYALGKKELNKNAKAHSDELYKMANMYEHYAGLPQVWKKWNKDKILIAQRLKAKEKAADSGWGSAIYNGMASFNESMNTGMVQMYANEMATTNAIDAAYTKKRLNAVIESHNNTVKTLDVLQSAPVSDAAFLRRKYAIAQRNQAIINSKAFYRVKGDLNSLYADDARFREIMDREARKVDAAQQRAIDNWVALDYEIDKVDAFCKRYPERRKELSLEPERDVYKIQRAYEELKDDYGYYYDKIRRLNGR